MKPVRQYLIWPLLFLAGISVAEASERWFQVEVLLFKNPPQEVDSPEAWPSFVATEQPERFIELTAYTDGSKGFKPLTRENRQLNPQRNALARGNRYQLLYHEAWNQPVPNRASVVPIRIEGGEKFGRHFELQGYINLYVERYLHLSTDLHLIEYELSTDPFGVVESADFNLSSFNTSNTPTDISLQGSNLSMNSPLSAQTSQYYLPVKDAHLKESRRMRSKEVHYFDNPEFGMLVLITPLGH